MNIFFLICGVVLFLFILRTETHPLRLWLRHVADDLDHADKIFKGTTIRYETGKYLTVFRA